MVGLVVWAHSFCRSTLAFYEGLAAAFEVPLKVFIWHTDNSLRTSVGHSVEEFTHIDYEYIPKNITLTLNILENYLDWHHIFGTYQKGSIIRNIINLAKRRGCHVAIASEAPCVINPPPLGLVKWFYVKHILKYVVRNQILSAEFIVNFSGDEDVLLQRIGWTKDRIVNCGYYSPPLINSIFKLRNLNHWENFSILLSGRHEWHRNPMVLLRAMRILNARNISVRAVIVQNGPLLNQMIQYVNRYELKVDFKGFVHYNDLVNLYQECSCFVATGRAEPWGIRVNDALHCGAPLIISEGMGAKKMVKDYGCGLVFSNNDPADLADKLESLITNKTEYLAIIEKVKQASLQCLPVTMSRRIADEIRTRYSS